jgi:cysteine desulfurase
LWERLQGRVPGIQLNGHPTERLPNTLNVRFPKRPGSEVLVDATEVAASTGSACHEDGQQVASDVVTAMGVDPNDALGSVRLSIGRGTTEADIERAADALADAALD